MKIFAFIFARGGSKGLPGKNIKLIAGKPLLAHSIELANKISTIDKVFVSTDDSAIAEIAMNYKAIVIDRPDELAQDESPEWLAWQHAVDWVTERYGNFDAFISLPATAPLRDQEDVEKCLKELDNETDMVITVTEAARSPWFNMVKVDGMGYSHLLIDEPAKSCCRRQDVPKAYDMTTVAYVSRPIFIRKASNIFSGRTKSVLIPKERAIDIDTEFDFRVASFLKDA